MVKIGVFNPSRMILNLILLMSILTGCSVRESTQETHDLNATVQFTDQGVQSNSTASTTSQILSTLTPNITRSDTMQVTIAAETTQNGGQLTSTPRPSPTSTLSPKESCQPFPDDIQYLGRTEILGYLAWTLRAYCKGEMTYLRSPVGEMTLFDYTALTGRFAYGPPDSTQTGLWVYDYWLGLSEKWLDKKVLKAEWAPLKNAEGAQILAILDHDGTLFISSGPFQIQPIAANVNHFSISPEGDRIAYVKGDLLYVIPTLGGQARKLAEEAFGTPSWSLEENALIFPSSPIKIAYLDGTGSFVPKDTSSISERIDDLCGGKRRCTLSSNIDSDQLLWDEQSHIIVFYAYKPDDGVNFRALYVYELSEDLRRITNRQTIFGDFTNIINWDHPGESIIDTTGNLVKLGSPPEIFSVQAKIISIQDQSMIVEFMWTNPWNTSRYGHQFTHLTLSDQTQIIDINGHPAEWTQFKSGMTMMLTARKLSPYTLSLFAYKIQIACDQVPCYLGFEGRS